MTIPAWLKQQLGTPTRSRGCKAVKCAFGCKADVLAGLDEDQMAFPAVADPTPLSALGEAVARIAGHRTYRLARHNGGMALWLRSHWDIRGHPASDEVLVVAEHRCNGPIFPSVEIKASSTSAKKSVGCTTEPPF